LSALPARDLADIRDRAQLVAARHDDRHAERPQARERLLEILAPTPKLETWFTNPLEALFGGGRAAAPTAEPAPTPQLGQKYSMSSFVRSRVYLV